MLCARVAGVGGGRTRRTAHGCGGTGADERVPGGLHILQICTRVPMPHGVETAHTGGGYTRARWRCIWRGQDTPPTWAGARSGALACKMHAGAGVCNREHGCVPRGEGGGGGGGIDGMGNGGRRWGEMVVSFGSCWGLQLQGALQYRHAGTTRASARPVLWVGYRGVVYTPSNVRGGNALRSRCARCCSRLCRSVVTPLSLAGRAAHSSLRHALPTCDGECTTRRLDRGRSLTHSVLASGCCTWS